MNLLMLSTHTTKIIEENFRAVDQNHYHNGNIEEKHRADTPFWKNIQL